MHTIMLVSIIGLLSFLFFRFCSRGEIISFFVFLICTAIALVSLLTIREYKLALLPAAVLLTAIFRMRQAYKRFQDE